MSYHGSIHSLFVAQATAHPNAPALLAVDRAPLSYAALHHHLCRTVASLNGLGVGRNDRVAIVLPNGPEMAMAFLAVAACATSAPLNPAYRAAEFDFYLNDLNAKAVIVGVNMDSPVREVAATQRIPLIELLPDPTTAGLFTLVGEQPVPSLSTGFATADDVALILHTSGTTARPKMVPLTQRNLLRSAYNIGTTLALSPADRCLNVMPLFHIHGLMAALLSSLAAGGSVVCTPGFDATHFFSWLRALNPTWYTAVPTMHQAILARAAVDGISTADVRLRFVRSSSSSLPRTVMAALEETFDAPVIEAYGMTEAAHQMASNPLPPLTRKPGSVGMAAGPEVAIMAEEEDIVLPTGETGEVVIRGENVTAGYLNNPEANAKSFVDGWFRTGDQGYLDAEGYLYLTGRLKELINRGGEKIAPREVDEVLLQHPAVAQALTFAMPDAKLGEEIAAAVTLCEKSITERELQRFVETHLADFKVPRRIIFLDEIPKGPTGKLQRIGMAEKLGLTADTVPQRELGSFVDATLSATEPTAFVAPRTQTESQLVQIWCDILKLPTVSVQQPFLSVGGDSMAAAQLVAQIQKYFAISLSVVDLFAAPTVATQAKIVDALIAAPPSTTVDGSMLRLLQQGNGDDPPLFFVPGGGGGEMEFLIYARLLHLLGSERSIYGFFARGQDGVQPAHGTVAEMLNDYLAALRAIQPVGPYHLMGECIGGKVAFELARRLQREGEEVALLLLLNTQFMGASRHTGQSKSVRTYKQLSALAKRPFLVQVRELWQRWHNSRFNPRAFLVPEQRRAHRIYRVRKQYNRILQQYKPDREHANNRNHLYEGAVRLLVSDDYYKQTPTMGLDQWTFTDLQIYPVPGDLHSYLGEHVATTAEQTEHCLQGVDKK